MMESADKRVLKIVYFGTYEKEYSRNKILIRGLKKNGVEVLACNVDVWGVKRDKTDEVSLTKTPFKLIEIAFAYVSLTYKYFRKKAYKNGVLVVGYPGHLDLFLAYFLTRVFHQKLVFDPLISLYETVVLDRRLIKNPFLSRVLFFLEKVIFSLCDAIVVDTDANGRYYKKLFNLSKKPKFSTIAVGAEENLFPYSRKQENKLGIDVLFVGKFSPLHGLPIILKSAKLLMREPNIRFILVGSGQLSESIKNLARDWELKNIKFISWIPYTKLHGAISRADICLGVFDAGAKADRVVPNKIFQAIAVGRPVVTMRSIAVCEVFDDGKNIVLSSKGDSRSLADAIVGLASNYRKRMEISEAAHSLYLNQFKDSVIGFKFKRFILEVLVNH